MRGGVVRYAVLLVPEPDGSAYNVTVPALPGCFTYGATIEEALANAREAITVHIDLPAGSQHLAEDRVEVIMATVAVGGT